MPPSDLFRPIAVAARQQRLWGDLVVTPLPGGLPATVTLLFGLVAAAALLWFGEFGRHERVSGVLQPRGGLVRVEPLRPGRVIRIAVEPGQQVAAGDLLMVLRDVRELPGGRRDRERVLGALRAEHGHIAAQREAESRRFEGERLALELRARELGERRRLLLTQRELIVEQERLLALRERRALRLEQAGVLTPVELEQVREAGLRPRRELAQLDVTLAELGEARAGVDAGLAALPAARSARLAELDAAIARLDARVADREAAFEFELRAPIAGAVSHVAAGIGDALRPGAAALKLLPAGARLEARLLVPSRAAGFLRPGQVVRLRYDAFPHARFGTHGGTLVEIGSSVLLPGEVRGPGAIDEPAYAVRVQPHELSILAYDDRVPLRPGMALQADIETDRRRLLFWLLDPLLAMRGRF